MRWTFKLWDYICIGRIPSPDGPDRHKGRWISCDLPWSEDVRKYGAPKRCHYYGKRWCWSFGAHTQLYDWKNDCWADYNNRKNYRRFVLSPRDFRERYDRKHVVQWTIPHSWFIISEQRSRPRRLKHVHKHVP